MNFPSAARLAMYAAFGLSLALPTVLSAQGDPFVGTWTLNHAKSKFQPGPAPKDQTTIMEASAQGIKATTKATDAAGKATTTSYTAGYDGKDYAVTGNADYDTVSLKRVNANTVEFTRKKAGKIVQTGTNVVAADGKSRTVTTTGTNAQGQKINNLAVYDKK